MSSADRLKRYLLPNLPCLLFVFAFANMGEGFPRTPRADASAKLLTAFTEEEQGRYLLVLFFLFP